MLVFNQSGLLVPDTLIPSSLQQLQEEFVFKIPTARRKSIFENFTKYNEDFKKVCNLNELQQGINGSYVSKKTNPGDIDVLTFLDHRLVKQLGNLLDEFRFPYSELKYGVDAYIIEVYPEDHNDNFRYVSDRAYWFDRFTKTRRIRGNRLSKGFIEIYV